MPQLNNKVLVRILKEEYANRVAEALKAVANLDGEKQNVLDTELKVKLRKDDSKRNIPAGTLYTIDAVGKEGVILRRDKMESDEPSEIDSYEPAKRTVSYADLSKEFDLD